MADENIAATTTTATAAVGELIKAAGNSKEGKEAASQFGKAAITVGKTLNNCLLPIAAVNYAFDKARNYFTSDFEDDLKKATADTPEELLVEPKASLAGPALQGLAFSHDEADLKTLYLELIATAMDERHARKAHPAFVEIIKQLTADEARLLRDLLPRAQHPVAMVKAHYPSGGTRTLLTFLTNWCDSKTDEPVPNPELPAMIVNWVRLGLIEVNFSKWISDDKAYVWLEERPELVELRKEYQVDGVLVRPQRGVMEPTALGISFAEATGIIELPPEP